MVFSSIFFIFFFLPAVILANFLCSRNIKLQNFVLMLFSIAFYYWGERNHIWIMLACVLVNYIFGIMIAYSQSLKQKKIYLISAITLSLGLLGYFKYFNFFIDNFNDLSGLDLEIAKIALPLGISFYTFHALSYVIDVYWGKIKAEKNFVIFLCYVSLFPQLVAGPIVRYRDIGHSFYRRYITSTGFRNGILRFCFGLGKKVLIANSLAVIVDLIFSMPSEQLNFGITWTGAIAYTLQIYFDFSGYSDMAIGIGLMLGFKYKENFNFPYRALSIRDFWRRWHISLASWLRDYLYIPLGGSKSGQARTYINLLIVFALCGFWHGASFAFIAWGLYHGVFLIFERTTLGLRIHQLSPFLKHTYTLLVVIFGWVLFRVENLKDAVHYMSIMLYPVNFSLENIQSALSGMLIVTFIIGIFLSLGFNSYLTDYLKATRNKRLIRGYKHISVLAGMSIFLICVLPLSAGSYSPFLYFRF